MEDIVVEFSVDLIKKQIQNKDYSISMGWLSSKIKKLL